MDYKHANTIIKYMSMYFCLLYTTIMLITYLDLSLARLLCGCQNDKSQMDDGMIVGEKKYSYKF